MFIDKIYNYIFNSKVIKMISKIINYLKINKFNLKNSLFIKISYVMLTYVFILNLFNNYKKYILKKLENYINIYINKAPGTINKPILFKYEVDMLDESKYFSDWDYNANINLPHPFFADFIVGDFIFNSKNKHNHFKTIQAAINAIVNYLDKYPNNFKHIYIYITPGIYNEIIFIPDLKIPLTLYTNKLNQVLIIKNLFTEMKSFIWKKVVNSFNKIYKFKNDVWKIYNDCLKTKINFEIDDFDYIFNTFKDKKSNNLCSSIVLIKNNNTRLINLNIQNLCNLDVGIALSIEADMVEILNSKIIGLNNSLFLSGTNNRIFIKDSFIYGNKDFIIGDSIVVCKKCEFNIVHSKNCNNYSIFAPTTSINSKYGFLVDNCKLKGDYNIKNAFLGTSLVIYNNEYNENINSQILIKNSEISDCFNINTPWKNKNKSYPFKGNIVINRNIHDISYNRMWEYNNKKVKC